MPRHYIGVVGERILRELGAAVHPTSPGRGMGDGASDEAIKSTGSAGRRSRHEFAAWPVRCSDEAYGI